jgi:hypothetical protein
LPVPERLTACALFSALSVNVSVPNHGNIALIFVSILPNDSATVCAALVRPTVTAPDFKPMGETVTGPVPVPLKPTIWGR